jgi:hypothetical protein
MLFSVDDGQEIMNEAEEPTPPQEETDGQDGQQQCKSFSLKRYITSPLLITCFSAESVKMMLSKG